MVAFGSRDSRFPGYFSQGRRHRHFYHGYLPIRGQGIKTLVLENEFYRLKIVSDRDGRIVEWIDKKQDNVNVVNLPNDSTNPNYCGLLDDHGWASTAAGFGDYHNFNYVYVIQATGPEKVHLVLWPFEQKHYKREIILCLNLR